MIPQFHRPIRSNWSPQTDKKSKVSRQRCWVITVFLLVVCMFFFVILLGFISLSQNVEVSPEDPSVAPVQQQPIVIPSSPRFIYIDVGCYNGETVEHFIRFNPNSSFYDIITFEPDPENFLLCEKVLRQPKYANLSIQIIPKAVWVRDEKVSFQVGLGSRSRINLNISGRSLLFFRLKFLFCFH